MGDNPITSTSEIIIRDRTGFVGTNLVTSGAFLFISGQKLYINTSGGSEKVTSA